MKLWQNATVLDRWFNPQLEGHNSKAVGRLGWPMEAFDGNNVDVIRLESDYKTIQEDTEGDIR